MLIKNESKPSATPPLPHTMLLLDGTFCSTLNGGGGGLEFYTNNQFARSNPVFNNCLNTFVQECLFTPLLNSELAIVFVRFCSFLVYSIHSDTFCSKEIASTNKIVLAKIS